ncbi:MAG: hypothetical protein ACE5KZ_06635 [Candidatus Scalinduaceae bacterium]
MYSKPYYDYEKKTVFAYFTIISCILHLIFIFSSSSFNRYLKSGFNVNDYVSNDSNYLIEIDLEASREEDKREKEEEILKEEKMDEEDLSEKNRQLFVDTSENTTDEEPQTDTDKIGEKGSIAKDMYPGKDNINNEPRLTSDFELLAKAPEELTSVKPQVEDSQIDTGGDIQPLVTEKIVEDLSSVNNSERIPADSEIKIHDEPLDESIVQDEKLDVYEDSNPQADEIDIIAPTLESEEVISEIKTIDENTENEVKTMEEKKESIPEPEEEFTRVASIPMEKIEEIVEESKENISNRVQEEIIQPESRINHIPPDDNAPFFEDDISNASIQGEESFNIKKHEYAPYYKHIRDKISWYWLLQYGTDASINRVTEEYKPIIVEFKALPSGKIIDVVIADSAGNVLLASKIQTSVQNTTLNRFPDYVNEAYINVRFNFYFY